MFYVKETITEATSIGGGFTGDKAENSVALGHKAGTTVKNGTAIGHESVATEEGTIAFGHDTGDVSGYTVKYPDKEITTHLGYKKLFQIMIKNRQ